ncbi:SCO family protein [Metabacillus fastidiosus]|uniref:SCO family protein n=1 Tax=Metabacillus fastidiosus TaxID=1458 RepID=UPI003D264FDD
MKRLLLLTAAVFLILAGCNQSYAMEEFTFKNQNGQEFGTENLKGKVWIADFIFTNCTTVCPPMSVNMAALQKEFKAEGLDVQVVSFSVDPTVDTPEKLKEYMGQFTDDDSNWNMLTGFSQEFIEKFAREQFQAIVQKPKSSDQVIHVSKTYLIDENGKIKKEYNLIQGEKQEEELIKDIKKML